MSFSQAFTAVQAGWRRVTQTQPLCMACVCGLKIDLQMLGHTVAIVMGNAITRRKSLEQLGMMLFENDNEVTSKDSMIRFLPRERQRSWRDQIYLTERKSSVTDTCFDFIIFLGSGQFWLLHVQIIKHTRWSLDTLYLFTDPWPLRVLPLEP